MSDQKESKEIDPNTTEQDKETVGVEPSEDDKGGMQAASDGQTDGQEYVADGTESFEEFELSAEVARAIEEMGYDAPMEVQSATFRAAMAGKNLVVQSRTGSGKTAAFGLPIAQGLVDPDKATAQALVLCPTRELARQVAEELGKLTKYRNIEVVALYGGAPIEPQVKALKAGAQVIVGTPGRVLDHLKRHTLDAKTVRLLVLDECDEMLSMGFAQELQAILEFLPDERQTLLFSATVTEDVQRMVDGMSEPPERVSLSDDFVGVREVDHSYYLVTEGPKHRDLLRILENEEVGSAIIFCNTREETTVVASFLKQQGWHAEAISSDLTQKERERVMARMRDGKIRLLVATDVAARGLDIEHVSHVINYSFPESAEIYVHRTGRTGRAGRKGTAISLVGPKELGAFYYMQLTYGIHPTERRLPTEQERISMREGKRLRALLAEFGKEPDQEFASLARRLWHSALGEAVFSHLLSRHFGRKNDRRRGSDKSRKPPSRSRERSEEHSRESRRSDRPRDEKGDRERGDSRRTRSSRNEQKGPAPSGTPKKRSRKDAQPDDSVRLYVNLGRKDGLGAKDISAFLLDVAGLESGAIRAVRLRDTHSYVTVDPAVADRIISEANGGKFKDRNVIVERARR